MKNTLVRQDFPFFSLPTARLYFDSAATSLKPSAMINVLADWYAYKNASVHRGMYQEAEYATAQYEEVRQHIAQWIGADAQEIIITKSATEGCNIVAHAWAAHNLKAGDEILLSDVEHHSLVLPLLHIAQQKGCKVRFVPLTHKGMLDITNYHTLLNDATKLVGITLSSNVLGDLDDLVINNDGSSFITKLISDAHVKGARVLVDAAQWVPHRILDVKKLKADFVVFSGHKLLGPTGVGVLYARRALHDAMVPYQHGGGMVLEVDEQESVWRKPPFCFEGGTPAVAEVIGFGAALNYIQENIDYNALMKHEAALCAHLIDGLAKMPQFRVLGPADKLAQHGHMVSFVMDGVHAHDIAAYLDKRGMSVRAGNHCAQLLHKRLGISNSVRVSFYLYNTHDEVQQLLNALHDVTKII
jgi:cysteine desulfurase / selenocysteine lyase